MRIRLDSIGCRLNIGEIEAMARSFAASGHSIVSQGDPADLCILNTCTVTAIASKKSRAFIRQLRRRNPGAKVVATGCLAELEPDSLEALGVDLVVGNDAKDSLPDLLTSRGWLACAEAATDDPPPIFGSRTRAFLKVQDGCDNRCTFCVVTIARGSGRSRIPDEIVAEVRSLADPRIPGGDSQRRPPRGPMVTTSVEQGGSRDWFGRSSPRPTFRAFDCHRWNRGISTRPSSRSSAIPGSSPTSTCRCRADAMQL